MRTSEVGLQRNRRPGPGGIVANEYLESEMRTDEGPVSHAYVRERPSLLAKQTSMRARRLSMNKEERHPQEGQHSADAIAAGPGTECSRETG